MIITLEQIRERQLKSIRKRIKLLEKDVKNKNKKYYIDFITVTFKDVEQYLNFKEKKFRSLLKNLLKNYFVESYFWCLEFQKRGVPHYHLLVLKTTNKKIGFIDLKKKYKQYVGFTNIKQVYTKNILAYLTKYLLKSFDKRKKIYKKVKDVDNKHVYKKIRYKQYGFGGLIVKKQEYKKIMKKYIKQKFEEKGIEIKKEYGWSYIERSGKKIMWRFLSNFTFEGLEIKQCVINVYEKKYKELFYLEYEFSHKYDIDIESIDDIIFVYRIIVMELDLDIDLN
jgi:hypothetical protein